MCASIYTGLGCHQTAPLDIYYHASDAHTHKHHTHTLTHTHPHTSNHMYYHASDAHKHKHTHSLKHKLFPSLSLSLYVQIHICLHICIENVVDTIKRRPSRKRRSANRPRDESCASFAEVRHSRAPYRTKHIHTHHTCVSAIIFREHIRTHTHTYTHSVLLSPWRVPRSCTLCVYMYVCMYNRLVLIVGLTNS